MKTHESQILTLRAPQDTSHPGITFDGIDQFLQSGIAFVAGTVQPLAELLPGTRNIPEKARLPFNHA